MKNVMVIGAHYDDAELGVGGTMAKLVKTGGVNINVYKLTLTDNETNFTQKNIKVSSKKSLTESKNACRILGVEQVDFEPVECCKLRYSTETMQRIEKIIWDLNIDTAFVHYSCDYNQDHVEASRLCKTALRHCDNILYYQSNGYILDKTFEPHVFVDISDTFEKKKSALKCYGSGHDRFNRLFDIVCKQNEVWGYGNEVLAAEGFMPVKMMI